MAVRILRAATLGALILTFAATRADHAPVTMLAQDAPPLAPSAAERVLFVPEPGLLDAARAVVRDGVVGEPVVPGDMRAWLADATGVTVQNLGSRPTRPLAIYHRPDGPEGDACAGCAFAAASCSAPLAPGATTHLAPWQEDERGAVTGLLAAVYAVNDHPARDYGPGWTQLVEAQGLPEDTTVADIVCGVLDDRIDLGWGESCPSDAWLASFTGGEPLPFAPDAAPNALPGEPIGAVVAPLVAVGIEASPAATIDRYRAPGHEIAGSSSGAEGEERWTYDLPGAVGDNPEGVFSVARLLHPGYGEGCATVRLEAYRTQGGFLGAATEELPRGGWLTVDMRRLEFGLTGSAALRIVSDRPLAAALTTRGYGFSLSRPASIDTGTAPVLLAPLAYQAFRPFFDLAVADAAGMADASVVAVEANGGGTNGLYVADFWARPRPTGRTAAWNGQSWSSTPLRATPPRFVDADARAAVDRDRSDGFDVNTPRAQAADVFLRTDDARGWETNMAAFNRADERVDLVLRLQGLRQPARDSGFPMEAHMQLVFQPGFGLGKPGGPGWAEISARIVDGSRATPLAAAVDALRGATDVPFTVEAWGVPAWVQRSSPTTPGEVPPRTIGLPSLGGPAIGDPAGGTADPPAMWAAADAYTTTLAARVAIQNPTRTTVRVAIDTYAACGLAGTTERSIDPRQTAHIAVRDLAGIGFAPDAAVIRVLEGEVAAVVEVQRVAQTDFPSAGIDLATAYRGAPAEEAFAPPAPGPLVLTATPSRIDFDLGATERETTIDIGTTAGGCVRWTADADVAWLTVAPREGALPGSLNVRLDQEALPPPTRGEDSATGIVRVRPIGGAGGEVLEIPVTVVGLEGRAETEPTIYLPWTVRER